MGEVVVTGEGVRRWAEEVGEVTGEKGFIVYFDQNLDLPNSVYNE